MQWAVVLQDDGYLIPVMDKKKTSVSERVNSQPWELSSWDSDIAGKENLGRQLFLGKKW